MCILTNFRYFSIFILNEGSTMFTISSARVSFVLRRPNMSYGSLLATTDSKWEKLHRSCVLGRVRIDFVTSSLVAAGIFSKWINFQSFFFTFKVRRRRKMKEEETEMKSIMPSVRISLITRQVLADSTKRRAVKLELLLIATMNRLHGETNRQFFLKIPR